MENLADRLKLYAAKKSTNNKRNTLVVDATLKKRKRLYARLAYCLLAEVRWRNMENEKWEAYYRSEAAAIRRILTKKGRVKVERQDLLSPLIEAKESEAVIIPTTTHQQTVGVSNTMSSF